MEELEIYPTFLKNYVRDTNVIKAGTNPNVEQKCLLLPCFYTDSEKQGKIKNADPKKWDRVLEKLSKPLQSYEEFKKAYSYINSKEQIDFPVLDHFNKKNEGYFIKIVNKIQDYTLEMPKLFTPSSIPLLFTSNKHEKKLTLTRIQVRCLLAGLFFGIMIHQNDAKIVNGVEEVFPGHESFEYIFSNPARFLEEKVKFILHYFDRVSQDEPQGLISFYRKRIDNFILDCDIKLKSMKIVTKNDFPRGIEEIPNAIHGDFANKFIGGGALHHGAVQEEILFVLKPECIVSILLCSKMEDNETVIIHGAEQFATYKGYGNEFMFEKDFKDETKVYNNHINNYILAFDALRGEDDYLALNMKRELIKAYCGFSSWSEIDDEIPIATGNWGCGAFAGDKQVKSMIQLIASSLANRNIIYHVFDDHSLSKELNEITEKLQGKSVGFLWNIMTNSFEQKLGSKKLSMVLFSKIKENLEFKE